MIRKFLLSTTLLFSLLCSEFTEARIASKRSLKESVLELTSKNMGGRVPGTKGHKLAINFIRNKLTEYKIKNYIVKTKTIMPWKPSVKNIYGYFPSKDTLKRGRRCIAFTAHYDGRAFPLAKAKFYKRNGIHYMQNALDNATGVAVLLELAKMFQEESFETKFDVYFIFTDQEENFIAGSRPALNHMKQRCSKVSLNINLDMLGSPMLAGLEQTIFSVGSESSHRIFNSIQNTNIKGLTSIQTSASLIEVDLLSLLFNINTFFKVRGARSDYKAFKDANIPFVMFTSSPPYFYHTPLDTLDKIDFITLRRSTDYIYSFFKNIGDLVERDPVSRFKYHRLDIQVVKDLLIRMLQKKRQNYFSTKLIKQLQTDLNSLAFLSYTDILKEQEYLQEIMIHIFHSTGPRLAYELARMKE